MADGTRTMLGFLPCGLGPTSPRRVPLVSLFWSVPLVRHGPTTQAELDRWKRQVLSLEPRASGVLEQIDEPKQLLKASYLDVTMPRFHAERLVFIGDAAHATSPQLGQGVNLALEDARVLAACVSAGRPLADALSCFSATRRAHVRYYQRASWGLTPFFQSQYEGLGLLRDALLGPICRFAPTRRLMLTTLSGVQRRFLGSTLALAPIRARLSRVSQA